MVRTNLIPLFLTFLISLTTQAQQRGYNWGYIITEKVDTLEGWVIDPSGNLTSHCANPQ